MIISFDYDGTLKRSSQLDEQECAMWGAAMRLFTTLGHTVLICTARTGYDADRLDIKEWQRMAGIVVPVIFCNEQGDKHSVCEAAGYRVDVWVDDMPESVRPGYRMVYVDDENLPIHEAQVFRMRDALEKIAKRDPLDVVNACDLSVYAGRFKNPAEFNELMKPVCEAAEKGVNPAARLAQAALDPLPETQ